MYIEEADIQREENVTRKLNFVYIVRFLHVSRHMIPFEYCTSATL